MLMDKRDIRELSLGINGATPAQWDEASKSVREARDTQVGGDHYSSFQIQPWDIIDEYELGFYEGNVLKYLLRDKGDRREDLEKCKHYIDKLLGDMV